MKSMMVTEETGYLEEGSKLGARPPENSLCDFGWKVKKKKKSGEKVKPSFALKSNLLIHQKSFN